MSKALYVAVVLTKESQNELFNLVSVPLNWRKIGHHMTITLDTNRELDYGKKTELIPVGIGMDNKGLAIKVKTDLVVDNSIPHITVAVAPGIKPVYSNELLKGNVAPLDVKVILSGFVVKVLQNNKTHPIINGLAD